MADRADVDGKRQTPIRSNIAKRILEFPPAEALTSADCCDTAAAGQLLPPTEQPMSETFTTMIDKERERLTKALEDLRAKQDELQTQRATLETELDALDTYESARSGKTRKSRKTASRTPRGSRQQSVLAVIAKSKKGMTRGDILQAMGLKGNKGGERSVSNALTVLKQAKRVTAKDRKYLAA